MTPLARALTYALIQGEVRKCLHCKRIMAPKDRCLRCKPDFIWTYRKD